VLETVACIVSGSLDIVATQPFIGPLAIALKKCVEICQTFRANKGAAEAFMQRLGEVADIVAMAVGVVKEEQQGSSKSPRAGAGAGQQQAQMHLAALEKCVKELTETLQRSCAYLEGFTTAGFLKKLLVGQQSQRMFQELDDQLARTLGNLMAALSLRQQALQSRTYEVVCDLEAKLSGLGGLAAILGDDRKLRALAGDLGGISVFAMVYAQQKL
jgi:hypothetical protein